MEPQSRLSLLWGKSLDLDLQNAIERSVRIDHLYQFIIKELLIETHKLRMQQNSTSSPLAFASIDVRRPVSRSSTKVQNFLVLYRSSPDRDHFLLSALSAF